MTTEAASLCGRAVLLLSRPLSFHLRCTATSFLSDIPGL